MNGMGFGWGTSRRVQDALVHDIQTITCSDLFLNLRNEKLYLETARLDQTGTCAAAGNPKRTVAFRSSPHGPPLPAAAHFLTGQAGQPLVCPLTIWLVQVTSLYTWFFWFFYFQSVLISLRSCKKTVQYHAVLCYAVPCRRARADTEKGQIDPDPTPPLWHKTDLYPSSSYAGTLWQLKTLQTSSSASRPSVVLLSLMPNSTA